MTGHRHTADGGPVVLDVGDDVGALVLLAPTLPAGTEIEISPLEEPAARSHVAVHPRELADRTIHAAVFPDLRWGCYQLWSEDGEPLLQVSVEGGKVTTASLPS